MASLQDRPVAQTNSETVRHCMRERERKESESVTKVFYETAAVSSLLSTPSSTLSSSSPFLQFNFSLAFSLLLPFSSSSLPPPSSLPPSFPSVPPSLPSHSLCCLLAHDDRSQLTVVPHQDHLLCTQHYGNHTLRLCCLGNKKTSHELLPYMVCKT